MSAIVRLQSSDGEIFDTDEKAAKMSVTIKTMLEDCCVEEGSSGTIIPLMNVNAAILRKVLEYANHHKDDPAPLDDDEEDKCKRTDNILPWDVEFLKVEQETLIDLIQAANYLDIKGLLDAACKTVANLMKNKSAEEIRKIFDLTNDFTPEEEEQVRRENEWCSDF